jgi:hypothetical protein
LPDVSHPTVFEDEKLLGSHSQAVERLQSLGRTFFRTLHHVSKRLLLGAVMILVVSLLASYFPFSTYITSCDYNPYTRANNPDTLGTALIHSMVRDAVSFGFVRIVILGLFLAAVWWSPYGRLPTALLLAAPVALYFPGLWLLEFMKIWLNDAACHVRANSISGHSYFFVYTVVLVLYFGLVVERHVFVRSRLPLIVAGVCAGGVGLNAVFTFAYGYHSLRQMLFGSAMGATLSALAIWGTELALERLHRRVHRPR